MGGKIQVFFTYPARSSDNLPREVVVSPSLEILKICLDTVLFSLL